MVISDVFNDVMSDSISILFFTFFCLWADPEVRINLTLTLFSGVLPLNHLEI